MHCKNRYHKAVSVSDEAFLWQVLTYYPRFWFGGVAQGCSDQSGITTTTGSVSESTNTDSTDNASGAYTVSGKKRKGPMKGFTETAGKTVKVYKEYLERVGESRESSNAKLWSKKLQEIAITKERLEETVLAPTSNTIAPVRKATNAVLTKYAAIQFLDDDLDKDSDDENQ